MPSDLCGQPGSPTCAFDKSENAVPIVFQDGQQAGIVTIISLLTRRDQQQSLQLQPCVPTGAQFSACLPSTHPARGVLGPPLLSMRSAPQTRFRVAGVVTFRRALRATGNEEQDLFEI